MESSQAKDSRLVRNGKKKVTVTDLGGKWEYRRQRVSKQSVSGKKVNKFPLDTFFGDRKRGRGYVSKNLEKKMVALATEQSYRQSERSGDNILGRESIRRKTIEVGKKAAKLKQTKKSPEVLTEQKTKDAGSAKDTYKRSKGSRIRTVLGKMRNWLRIYVMIDGVGVQGQGEGWEGSKECKVCTILMQKGEKITEVATFCTWERLPGFKRFFEWTLLSAIGVVGLFAETVLISDGAKWIRNLRKSTSCLGPRWILDWFHVKDRVESVFRVFLIEETDSRAEEIIMLLWNGKVGKTIKCIQAFPMSDDTTTKEKQTATRNATIKYLINQREGIVNYKQLQRKGYFVGSGFVEKRNDTLVKNRMVRQKRMRWSREGGEAMMHLLTARANGRFAEAFI